MGPPDPEALRGRFIPGKPEEGEVLPDLLGVSGPAAPPDATGLFQFPERTPAIAAL